jgi:hypothetical protein
VTPSPHLKTETYDFWIQWLRLGPSKRPNTVGDSLPSPENGNSYDFWIQRLRLGPSKWPNTVGDSLPSPEDGNSYDFWIQWMRLGPSKGPNTVGVSLPSPEDGNSYDFWIQWLRLGPSKWPNTVGESLPSPEDRNRSNFRKVVFSSYLELRTRDKVHRPSDSECYTPSSESFSFYDKTYCFGLVVSQETVLFPISPISETT